MKGERREEGKIERQSERVRETETERVRGREPERERERSWGCRDGLKERGIKYVWV